MDRVCKSCHMYYPLTIYGNSAPFFMNECGHFFCKRCTMHATACYVCHKAMYLAMAIKDGVTYTLDGARLKRYSQMHNSRELNNAQLTKLRQFEKVTCFGARQAANPVSVPSVASTSQCSCATNCYGYYCELTTQPSREVTVDPTLTDAIQRNNKLMTSPKLSTLPTYYRQDLENFLCIRPQYTNRQLYQFCLKKPYQEDDKQQLRNILMVFERSDDGDSGANEAVVRYMVELKGLPEVKVADNDVIIEDAAPVVDVDDDEIDLTTNKAEEHDTTVDREMINEVDDDDDYDDDEGPQCIFCLNHYKHDPECFLFEKGIIQEDEKQQLRNILMVFERSDLTTNKAEEHDTTVDREMINEVDDDDDYDDDEGPQCIFCLNHYKHDPECFLFEKGIIQEDEKHSCATF
ncbi:ORF27 [Cydia pomonella granulovirus]|uniref:ORF27 n=1 Tax=Cydia pomonella granulosis virus (isolate Mexico/1963) TaxID=654905 RepID=Q91F26_GVCPM|nr:ORF27 [Cydia pomonella granulovirus]AAK70687.1 ORF27 [Cydia pomonella granulovirus]